MMAIKQWIRSWAFLLLVLAGLILPVAQAEATHLRAGEITVERVNCTSRRFKVTVTVYTDTNCTSCVLFGGSQDILDFGDGSRIFVPETPNTPYPGGGGIGIASRTFIHDFPAQGKYTISYIEPNRNAGVLNMSNSVGTTFYLETQIDLSVLGCGNSPKLLVPPIDRACTGVAFYHNPGAYDEDGDSLSYELVVPFRDRNTPVTGYRDPNDPSFYSDFSVGNETGDGPATFSINGNDGTIIWNAPSLPQTITQGEFNIAFVIKEWRKSNGQWIQIGFVRRDMQIIVERCDNERPRLEIPEDLCVTAGTIINETIFGYDDTPAGNPPVIQNHPVKIEAYSEIFASTFPSPATFQPNPPVFGPSTPAQLQFTWNTICKHVKDQPYQVVFKITDNPSIGPKLVTFETWGIRVVAPPPLWQSPIVVDFAKRYATLEWQSYECNEEAATMQIWRKVGDTSFTPAECDTGMPPSLGFTLVAEIPLKNAQGNTVTTYTDTNGGKGLNVGAKYCYRLVAVFPLPKGGESYVSQEVCMDPILSDAPVITNVTVDKTGDNDGQITVRWTPPFDIDPVQFPGPYEYVVQRANGAAFLNVSASISDTSFVDQGLDTKDITYFYRVVLYSPTISNPIPQPVDTSALASSVTLELSTQLGRIDLHWSADVPWSNQMQSFPLHDIYRGPEGATTEADLQLIATVNVIQDGFTYPDTGQHNGVPLDDNTEYCYLVKARGGYGNPDIEEPLINFSQINCARPVDEEPPCAPEIQPFTSLCNEDFTALYGCNPTNFTNTITWSVACSDDARMYNVYVAGSTNGTYTLLATNVRDTFYLDKGLASLARCYRVSSVDRSGNESELSEPICNDNCPYYELPNVFTPGDGDKCNDFFSAYGAEIDVGENSNCPISDLNNEKCARFVLRINFTVFNRWGKEVYNYEGQLGDENSIYINWDGRSSNGSELNTGIYYYLAEVTYDVVDPSQRVKMIKGWVHLIRYSN